MPDPFLTALADVATAHRDGILSAAEAGVLVQALVAAYVTRHAIRVIATPH